MHQNVLILDFGAQYAQLIARRVRSLGIYCELYPWDVEESVIRAFNPKAIILSGGPSSVTDKDSPRAPDVVFTLGVPVLGICYGMQTMAVQLGGQVSPATLREFGAATIRLRHHSALFAAIQDSSGPNGEGYLNVWMSHGDQVSALPAGFSVIADNEATPIVAMADEDRRYYGVQFHPEVTHTPQGTAIIARFLKEVTGIKSTWNMPSFLQEAVHSIRQQVGLDQVILGLSGGVDSSVVAALVHKAIGDQLICVFVDHGMLRLNEASQVMQVFSDHLGVRVILVNAQDQFAAALAKVSDPEAKRKIIGREFVAVFQDQAKQFSQAKWLAQGTIYPDVIESAGSKTNKAHAIKSHHNVGGLPETLNLKLLEPLRDLFKDEVRQLGLELGLPPEMVYRHPFPGPGLAVRILGAIEKSALSLLQQADAIFIEELHKANWYHRVAQAFAVFLPVRSVGVMGDGRTYEHVIALRAVVTTDFMTAEWAELPYSLLAQVSNRIINEVRGINRVVYDISGKPPATIEWE